MRQLLFTGAVIAALTLMPATVQGQETGVISGQVIAEGTNEPLVGVQMSVVGTTLGALTDQDGRFLITGVPAGEREVRATLLGYSRVVESVDLAPGETAVLDFVLEETAIALEGVVVTATGQEQRRREIGSSVGLVETAEVEMAPIQSFSNLLQGRVAGMSVLQSSGTTGAGSRIRIRGNNSMSLSNDPLLVIDGVRVESGTGYLGFGVGGQAPSRLNDLNPEEIESIEILKGPAAAALYGTAAANGVIQVTTKRGRAGAAEFRAWAEYGTLQRTAEFPLNVNELDAAGNLCTNLLEAQGLCTPAERYEFNPLENAETTPFEDGNLSSFGGSVSGGSDAATFFISGELSQEDGVYTDGDQFEALGDDFDDMDDLRHVSLRANMTGNVGSSLTVGANAGYISSNLQLPQADNAVYGIVGMGLGGIPTPAYVDAWSGYGAPPAAHYDWITSQDVRRFTGSLNAEYRPLSWLTLNATAGLDQNDINEMNRLPRENFYGTYFGGVYTGGFIQLYDFEDTNINTNTSGTAIFNLTDDLLSTTTLGGQYLRENYNYVYSFGTQLLPGVEESLAGATANFEAGEGNTQNATVSAYLQQQFAWNDRVFINGAVRGDQNTAFGQDIGWVWYPSTSGSWVISEESFFPENDMLSSMRLRAAYGQAGLRPGATAAIQTFSGITGVLENVAQPGFVISALGNPDLEPERTSEWELGFETGLFDERFGVEATYFSKTSEDALVSQPLPGSLGGSGSRWVNIGEVSNSGLELLLNGLLVDTDVLDWEFSVSGSFIDNELVDLGEDAQGDPIPEIIFGLRSTQRHQEGYPLGAWFQRPIESFGDENGDGLIGPGEVVLADTAEYLGSPFPSREFAFTTDLQLWDWLGVSAMLDYRGGYHLLNATRGWRADQDENLPALYDDDVSLERQAEIVALVEEGSWAGFIEDASFTKLREVALTFGVPPELAARFGAEGLRLTLAGRNLATWTDYTGLDPEVSFQGQSNFVSGEFSTLPPNRVFTVRVDANF